MTHVFNHKKLARRVAKQNGLTAEEVLPVLDTLISVLHELLIEGTPVKLGDLGQLVPEHRKKKKAFNVAKKEAVELSYYSIKFAPSTRMREEMKERAKYLDEIEKLYASYKKGE